MTFLESIEGLASNMSQAASHIGAALKKAHPAHVAYGTMSRMERALYDCSKQFEQILAQVSPELRGKLENMEANNVR
jgi:hypothetical protein